MNRILTRLALGPLALLAACSTAPKDEPPAIAAPVTHESPAPAAPPSEPTPVPPPAPEPVAEIANSQPAAPPAPVPEFREVFPHVQFDAATKAIRLDGVVPIDVNDEKAPWVYLEVSVCTPDSKEHETLAVTEAKPSHVHAALLLAGLTPGSPGKWKFENNTLSPIPPSGDEVIVTLTFRDKSGAERTLAPQDMIVSTQTGKRFSDVRPGKWVFAGSQMVTRNGREWYDADGAGTLVGLTTFGSETIAWSQMISHEAAVEEPVWIADRSVVPPFGTPVTITIKPAR